MPKKLGDLKATIGKEKIYIDDSRLKETGTIFLTIDGARKIEYSYNVKDKTAGPHFTDTLTDVVRRANLGKDEGRMISKIKTLWNTYRNQYNESIKQMAKQPTALKKITTAAKAIRKKQPGKSWKAAIKQASKDYRQTGGSSKRYDQMRKAKPPGKRRSHTGKTYYERRKNRSDVPGTLTGKKKSVSSIGNAIPKLTKNSVEWTFVKRFKKIFFDAGQYYVTAKGDLIFWNACDKQQAQAWLNRNKTMFKK